MILRKVIGWLAGGCLSCSAALGQEIVAELRLDKREPRPERFAYTPGDGGLVTLAQPYRNSSRELAIYKYDASFDRQWTKPLLDRIDRYELEGLFVLGAEILVFYSEYFPRENTVGLYLNRYSLDGKREVLRQELATSANESKLRRLFNYTRSLDRQRLVAIGQLDPPKADRQFDRDSVALSYLVFEAGMESVRQGRSVLPYINQEFDWEQTEISRSGSFWVLGRIVPDGEERTFEAYPFTLFRIDPETQQSTEIRLDFGDRNITDLRLKANREDRVLAAGFYSNQRNDQIIGVLYARVNAEQNVLEVAHYAELPPEFLSHFLTAGQIQRGREISDLYLDHIVLRADGGALLLAEEFFITTSASNTVGYYPGYYDLRRFYHYEEIAALSLDPQGRIEWSSILPKSQISDDQDQLSYFPFIVGDRVLFFYKGTERGTGSSVFLTEMDYDGHVVSPKPFFQAFQQSDEFYPGAAEQISNREAILVYYVASERTFTIAKLRY